MTRLPSRPNLDWKDDGTPVATAFDDVYFSRSDGLEETRAVFFRACGLPDRWRDQKSFTIAELGFGTGLNFLALVDLWLGSERCSDGWLDFLTVEKHPMAAEDARKSLERWPELKTYADQLLSSWPEQTMGLQRIVFPQWRISLSIFIGDAADWFNSVDFKADAWFLDGFAPAKNEAMWSEDILKGLGDHAKPGCLVGTYTVAGHVRRGLAAAGFEVSKQPGFGRKRERLEAIYPDHAQSDPQPDIFLRDAPKHEFERVIVVGAGIGGASVARQFAEVGLPVTVIDRAEGPGSGASGNPYGLVMPRLDAADTPQARFLIQSYLYALSFYARYAPDFAHQVSVRQTPQSDAEIKRFSKLAEDPPLNDGRLSFSDEERVSLIHHGAALVEPAMLVAALLDHPGIDCRWNQSVGTLKAISGKSDEKTLTVISAGHLISGLLPEMAEWIAGKAGQVELAKSVSEDNEALAIASGSYALRKDGDLLFGATFEPFEGDAPAVTGEARTHNIEALGSLAPDWAGTLVEAQLVSRASVRATTPDRFPIAGCWFDRSETLLNLAPLQHGAPVKGGAVSDGDVYVMAGLGARGFTFAPLLADLIVSQALGRPLPLARSEQEIVSPVRFLVRAIRKGQITD